MWIPKGAVLIWDPVLIRGSTVSHSIWQIFLFKNSTYNCHFVESFICTEYKWNKQKPIWEFVQIDQGNIFNCPKKCRWRIFVLKSQEELDFIKGKVFNVMAHCQTSCLFGWTNNTVNHAINVIHLLSLLKRGNLPIGSINVNIVVSSSYMMYWIAMNIFFIYLLPLIACCLFYSEK